MERLKNKLWAYCQQLIAEKISSLENELKNLSDSAASDTKSSMGDKYETSREMINLEKGKIGEQLMAAQQMQLTLHKIKDKASSTSAELGSLVKTERGIYFLSVPLGQISIEDDNVFCISPMSPIGQAMLGKKANDSFQFGKNNLTILELS